MKIIGGHDYYDGAGYGVDETIIFLRKEEEIIDPPFEIPEPYSGYAGRRFTLSFHYVLVAGKVYPAIREYQDSELRASGRGWSSEIIKWHFTLEEAEAALETLQNERQSDRFHYGLFRRLPDEITRHFRENEKPDWTKWMIENRVVTGQVSWDRRSIGKDGSKALINIATLKDIDFYRMLDPATIHMEIANFVGGVLPTSIDTIEISDIDRVRKAGFDTKTSFRQDPGVKKPRRKKKA